MNKLSYAMPPATGPNNNPQSAVLHRNLNVIPLIAAIGYNEYIHSRYPAVKIRDIIDISSGAGVTCLGYGSHAVKFAMRQQIDLLPYAHAANWTTDAAEMLAKQLLIRAGGHFKNGAVMFLNTGAEAVEGACKIAMQYHIERGNQDIPQFIARQHSYHGASVFTLCLGDHPRKSMYPLTAIDQRAIMRTRPYMPQWDQPDDLEAYRMEVLENLTQCLKVRSAQGRPCIVVIEPIGGTAIAIEPADAEYLTRVRSICKVYDAVLIYDEILCGNYRTGHLFAYQTIGLKADTKTEPDIICMGKGLTAGYFPLSAVIVSEDVVNTMRNGTGRLWHSSTNQNHPIGCAAGLAALAEYDRILVNGCGPALHKALDECATGLEFHNRVLKVTGMGALRGVRLLLDGAQTHGIVRQKLMELGVAAYTEGGTVNGGDNMILLAPPYTMDPGTLCHAVDRILKVLGTM